MDNFNQEIPNLTPEQKARLSQYVQQRRKSTQDSTIQRRDPSQRVPLSFAQQRLWFLAQLNPNSIAYNETNAISIQGDFSVELVQRVLNQIIQRHESLRTRFEDVEGNPFQVIQDFQPIYLKQLDLRSLTPTQQEAESQRLMQQWAQRPFELTQASLFRPVLLRLSETESILQVTRHHIISDGWSSSIFWQEFCTLYTAFLHGQPSPLTDLPIQYGDFSVWQHQEFQSGKLQPQMDYWLQQLKDSPTVLNLPSDRPRPPHESFSGKRYSFTIPGHIVTVLKSLSQAEGCTLFMTMLTAFNVLLYRYTQQPDILIGTPIANRQRVETEGLIGFFANTLVLRTHLSGNLTFRDLLKQVRTMALAAYDHQDFPFEKLVEALPLDRTLSHNPLFQVMFSWQNLSMPSFSIPGLVLSPMKTEVTSTKVDLSLLLRERSDHIQGDFEYSTELFDPATVMRMAGHFEVLLEDILANPNQSIAELSLLTDFERHLIFTEWNNTQIDYPQDKCIHHLFEEQVERTPDAIAVVFRQKQLTYRELNNKANQLAHYLQTLGVKPDTLVGICVEQSLEMLVGLLGILKAGGAYVPFDASYPQDRLVFLMEDSQIGILLTQENSTKNLPDIAAQVVCLDKDWTAISALNQSCPIESGVTVDHLAYLIYTSGSTGQPKGVEIAHHNAVNLLYAVQHNPGLSSQDTLLSVTSPSFDIAVVELFLPLSVGARLVLVSRDVSVDGHQLRNQMDTMGVTYMQATPATWRLLLAAGWSSNPTMTIVSTGDALSRDLANQLIEGGASLWNLYGPTETTIWATGCQIKSGHAPITIGMPLPNTQVYILDTHLQPVPIGVTGELYVGGAGVSRGYLNRPALTAEKFIPNLFNPIEESYLYKTGDLARYLPHGSIECLGRIDYQVKIRGFRIELGEIESVLVQHPQVEDVVAIARDNQLGERDLIAYVVLNQQQVSTLNDLHQFLKQKLPSYMIPAAFVPLDAFPLTPNGKIDRYALSKNDWSEQATVAFIAPRDPIEQRLVDIWSEVLQLEQVGIHDDFFALGGHSLLATQVMSRIIQVFSVKLDLSTLFDSPTVAELAHYLTVVCSLTQGLSVPISFSDNGYNEGDL